MWKRQGPLLPAQPTTAPLDSGRWSSGKERLGGAAAFRHAGGQSAQDLRAAGAVASLAAFAVSKLCSDLPLEASVIRIITASVCQFLLGFGRATLAVPTGLDDAAAKSHLLAITQLGAMACCIAAAAERRQPSKLAELFSPDVVTSHDLILWLTTMTEALRLGQSGECPQAAPSMCARASAAATAAVTWANSCLLTLAAESAMEELTTYLSLLCPVMDGRGSEQHTATLAASPRALAAAVNLLVDRGLPTLLSYLPAELQRAAQQELPLCGAVCVLLVRVLQHPALQTALERRLHGPGGAAVVQLAAQLARLLSNPLPMAWRHDQYVEVHNRALSLCLLCCSIMGEQPPGHTAPRAQQLAAARELLQALPHWSLSLHTLNHPDVEAGQLVQMCTDLLAALDLLGAVRTASSSEAGGSQLGIASQADAEGWLAACEAALCLV